MMLLLLLLATSFLTLLYICHFNFLTSLFALSGCIPSYALGTVLLVTLEHPIFFWAAVICTVSSCFTNFVSLPIPVLHIPAWVQSHYSGYIFGSCRQRASLLGSHPSCLRVLYPFLLFLLSMCAIPLSRQQSFEISLRQGIYWSAIGYLSSKFHLDATGLSFSS